MPAPSASRPNSARYPLPAPARAMLEGCLNTPSNGAYLQGQLVFFSGEGLTLDNLVTAARTVTEEAEVFRMYAERGDDGEWSLVEYQADPEITTATFDYSGTANPDEAVREFARARLREGWTITERRPQTNNFCFTLGENRAAWFSLCHHVFGDGYAGLLARMRASQILAALTDGTEVPPPSFGKFGDLVSELEEPDPAGLTFWTEMLDGAPTAVSMASRTAPPAALYEEIDLYNTGFIGDLRAFDASLKWPHAAAAACVSYVSAIVDDTDVVTGFPVANRTSLQEKITPAQLMAALPLRVQVDPGAAFTEFTGTVRDAIRSTREHQRQPVEKIRAAVPQAFRTGRLYGPTVNIIPFFMPGDAGSLDTEAEVIGQGPVDDLMFVVEPWQDAGVRIKLLFNPDLYDADTRALHAERFAGWVRQIQAAPSTELEKLACLTAEERRRHEELAGTSADDGGRADRAGTWGESAAVGDYAAAAGIAAGEVSGLAVRTALGRLATFGRTGQVVLLTDEGERPTEFRAEVTAEGLRTRGREDERFVVAGNWVELGELRRALRPLAREAGVDADEIAFDASTRRIGVTFPGGVGADMLDKAKAVLGEVTGSPVRIR